MFNEFIRDRILPHCTPYASGGPISILIMDNCKIYWNSELTEMCQEAGVRLEYLPLYSPDLNPIETSFAVLKAWIKRHQDIGELFATDNTYREFLNLAVEAQDPWPDAGNLFRLAGIEYKGINNAVRQVEESDEEGDI